MNQRKRRPGPLSKTGRVNSGESENRSEEHSIDLKKSEANDRLCQNEVMKNDSDIRKSAASESLSSGDSASFSSLSDEKQVNLSSKAMMESSQLTKCLSNCGILSSSDKFVNHKDTLSTLVDSDAPRDKVKVTKNITDDIESPASADVFSPSDTKSDSLTKVVSPLERETETRTENCDISDDFEPIVRRLRQKISTRLKNVCALNTSSEREETPSKSDEDRDSGVPKKLAKVFDPPKLKDRTRDIFCWKCHKFCETPLICSRCTRVMHSKCSSDIKEEPDTRTEYVCYECEFVKEAESKDGVERKNLSQMLKFVLRKMRVSCELSENFENPVDLVDYPDYLHFVLKPMCLALLEKNIEKNLYKSPEAFLADFKYMVHNSYIFNSASSKLTYVARGMLRVAMNECNDLSHCYDCYLHANTLDAANYFIEPCSDPHLIVWAKLQSFPYWPGKILEITSKGALVKFFGDHNKAFVPLDACFLFSRSMPTRSKLTIKLKLAIKEVGCHFKKLETRSLKFYYPPPRTAIKPEQLSDLKKLMFRPLNESFSNDSNKIEYYRPTRGGEVKCNTTLVPLFDYTDDPYDSELKDPETDPLALDSDSESQAKPDELDKSPTGDQSKPASSSSTNKVILAKKHINCADEEDLRVLKHKTPQGPKSYSRTRLILKPPPVSPTEPPIKPPITISPSLPRPKSSLIVTRPTTKTPLLPKSKSLSIFKVSEPNVQISKEEYTSPMIQKDDDLETTTKTSTKPVIFRPLGNKITPKVDSKESEKLSQKKYTYGIKLKNSELTKPPMISLRKVFSNCSPTEQRPVINLRQVFPNDDPTEMHQKDLTQNDMTSSNKINAGSVDKNNAASRQNVDKEITKNLPTVKRQSSQNEVNPLKRLLNDRPLSGQSGANPEGGHTVATSSSSSETVNKKFSTNKKSNEDSSVESDEEEEEGSESSDEEDMESKNGKKPCLTPEEEVESRVFTRYESVFTAVKRAQWCQYCLRRISVSRFYCCAQAHYCSASCQEKHWKTHQKVCTQNSTSLANHSLRLNPDNRQKLQDLQSFFQKVDMSLNEFKHLLKMVQKTRRDGRKYQKRRRKKCN